ncbi:MAG: hypothetical protein ABIH25_00345 [Candidatus Woesearchaeota archaeon]
MIYNLNEVNEKELKEFLDTSLEELKEFYKLGEFQTPNLFILKDRKTIDQLKGKKTEDWLVGWSVPELNSIFVLEKSKFGTESKKVYSDNMYNKLLKHELVHIIYHKISKNRKPVWLSEGIAIYLSGQYLKKTRPEKFKNFLNFYNEGGSEVYEESGFAVELLINKFGKEKLLTLIKSLNGIESDKEFLKKYTKLS